MEGCWSKIHIPCERGPHKDNKNHKIFQICREKFLRNFRENLGRVSPCPSTWHKYDKTMQKNLWSYLFFGSLSLSSAIGISCNQIKHYFKELKKSIAIMIIVIYNSEIGFQKNSFAADIMNLKILLLTTPSV